MELKESASNKYQRDHAELFVSNIRISTEVEESGLRVSDACRPFQISKQTVLPVEAKRWWMDVAEARRLKELEGETARLKWLVADQTLDIQILKEVNSKSAKPHSEAHAVKQVVSMGRSSGCRACRVVGLGPNLVLALEAITQIEYLSVQIFIKYAL